MSGFLFDIRPCVGNVCSIARLARLIGRRKYQVCYTDTSDSALTSALLAEGIGRILYPDDLRWFTPDLVLLDRLLADRETVYRACSIDFLFLSVQRNGDRVEQINGTPVISLTPYPCWTDAPGNRCQDFLDKLGEIKDKQQPTVIIGLLEDGCTPVRHLLAFYKAVRQNGMEHPQCQFVILTNEGKTENALFTLPENVSVYRQTDLHALLPLCDMALLSQGNEMQDECIFAEVPAVELTPKEIAGITPQKLDKRIMDTVSNRAQIIRRQNELGDYYRRENQRLDEVADRLINRIEQKKQP